MRRAEGQKETRLGVKDEEEEVEMKVSFVGGRVSEGGLSTAVMAERSEEE